MMNIRKRDYGGWPNSYFLDNGAMELVVTGDVGPRVIRCGFVGGENLFHNEAGALGRSGEGRWENRGGHRLWVAPENPATTLALDNEPVSVAVTGEGVVATQPMEPETRLQKQIEIRLAAEAAEATVTHRVKNLNPWAVRFAPWALSVMAPGGVALAVLPPRCRHEERLLPTGSMAIWGYTDLSDARWRFLPRFLLLRQEAAAKAAQKIGLFNSPTQAGYERGGELFWKWTETEPEQTYPDFGCSLELFTNADMLEVETLGPLAWIEPGGEAVHVEHWSLHRTGPIGGMDDGALGELVDTLPGPARRA